ncbi:hypothetical protein [Sphingomonas sp. 3-13AW]|jgi:hypothetical protein|uniref:hypothetical protein n=1 Tax=Sphingomonas sp. 3-13AW TaxID=3050450 RepID=UPI003BB4FBB7
MRNVIVSAIFALGLARCGASPASITINELAGDYRAPGCPVIQVRDSAMLIGEQRIRLNLIRIKLEDVIVAYPHPRVVEDKGCGFVIVNEPIYMPVQRRNSGLAIGIQNADGEAIVAFKKVGSAPTEGN